MIHKHHQLFLLDAVNAVLLLPIEMVNITAVINQMIHPVVISAHLLGAYMLPYLHNLVVNQVLKQHV